MAIGHGPISSAPISAVPASAVATDDTVITTTRCDDNSLFDYCYDLATDTEEQPDAIARVTLDDAPAVTDNEYTTVLPDAQVDDDLEVLEFLDFARGPPDQDDGYVLPSVWPIDDEPVEDDQTDDSIRRILSAIGDETGETAARFVFADDPDEQADDVEGFALATPDQDDQYVLTPAQDADDDAEDFDSSFVMMSPDDAAAVVDATIVTLTACEDSVTDTDVDTDDAPDAPQRVTLDDAPVATDDSILQAPFDAQADEPVEDDADVVWQAIPAQDDDYLRLAQADQADDIDEDVDGILSGPLEDAPVVTDYVTVAFPDPDEWVEDDDLGIVATGTIDDAPVGLADNEPRPILQADDDDWQAEDNTTTDSVASPFEDAPVVVPPTGGGRGKAKKRRVIPAYENSQTTDGVAPPQGVSVQAGERGSPPPAKSLPADQLVARALFEPAPPIVPKQVSVTQPVDASAWAQVYSDVAKRQAAIAAERARLEEERRAAEQWLAEAVMEMGRNWVQAHIADAERALEEYHRLRRKREEEEERFLILAAMEMFD